MKMCMLQMAPYSSVVLVLAVDLARVHDMLANDVATKQQSRPDIAG